MEKTFVEDLWEKFPEQTINAIKKITKLNDYSFEYSGFENNCLKFDVYNKRDAEFNFTIYINDFYINTSTSCEDYKISKQSIQWINFMYGVYGETYALQYISRRKKQLDEFMDEYEKNYNNETIKVLREMRIKKYQDIQNHTK